MADIKEKWEQDEEWLYETAARINKRPTVDDVEFFCERVSIIAVDGVSEKEARLRAFYALYYGPS